MATSAEIKRNINYTRNKVSVTVDEISNRLQRKIDVQEKIRENPYTALMVALGAGFLIATFNRSFGKSIFKLAVRTGTSALGAYVSKQGVKYVSSRLKH